MKSACLTLKPKDWLLSPTNRLTALVAQGLRQAQQHIYIDDAIISEALEWLANNQAVNGSFTETGSIVHRKIQSLDGNSLALTAFTAISFIENQVNIPHT